MRAGLEGLRRLLLKYGRRGELLRSTGAQRAT
jgi:hypothetical protein